MKQEYTILIIVGLFIAAYVLEAIVQPLGVDLATPYHFLTPETLTTYPFTTAVIAVRATAIFLAPLWLMSFFEKGYTIKGSISLVLAGLSQLYVLQELATGNQILPLEWALAISVAGMALVVPMVIYFLRGLLYSAHTKLTKDGSKQSEAEEESEDEE